MKKSIFYNLIICVALVSFILVGTYILMYDKIPTSSSGLQEKSYSRTAEIDAYIGSDATSDKEKNIKSYEVNNNDLEQLRKENIYKAGKSNPFGEYKKQMQKTTNVDISSNVSTNRSTTSNSTNDSGNNNEVTNTINPQDDFSRTNVINTK